MKEESFEERAFAAVAFGFGVTTDEFSTVHTLQFYGFVFRGTSINSIFYRTQLHLRKKKNNFLG
jgi:hypothetical protein